MIAQLIYDERRGYYCSNCRMIQREVHQQCEFCGLGFSNYEEVLTQIYTKWEIESDKE